MVVAPPFAPRPRLGVAKLASCDGCQLTLLDLADDVLGLAEHVEIVEFPEASSARSEGPYDVLLVEGSVSTPGQAAEIRRLRQQARTLITIGACAQAGGVQALRNWMAPETVASSVYPNPDLIEALERSSPISDVVSVDLEVPGCPVSRVQLREVLVAALLGRRPQLPDEAVCLDCKRRGIPCLLVTGAADCLGPLTRTGCGALCPSVGRGCFGCFGPRERANTAALAGAPAAEAVAAPAPGSAPHATLRPLPLFTAWAPAWRERHEAEDRPAGTGAQDDARH
jgi:sulfhydrogenase subunit delta